MIYILNAKLPGLEADVRTIALDAPYSMPGLDTPDAYETLLHDVLLGEAALFSRADEVEESWRIVKPILNAWQKKKGIAFYAAGADGPPGLDSLIGDCEGCWRGLSASHQHGRSRIS
jgi:glucose-6-phosphate 1-dehydrogenase